MPDRSDEQRQRLERMIDKMFLRFPQKDQLIRNLGDEKGDFSQLSEMPNEELEELITMEKKFIERKDNTRRRS